MGKTKVRKYVHTTDAQSVWKDFQEHMKSSSKGASEKRRLTQYITNTVLDDNYKGTTEQFVLHFNEQFRQLEEIPEESAHFPSQIKLQLLQNAVRPINDLRILETLDEFQSITTGYGRSSSLKYQTYYDLLINACVRYDRTKNANIARRGHIYTKQPSHQTMMVLLVKYHLRLQIVKRSGAPANCWLLCMIYVCYILNHILCGVLNGSIPLLVLYGITPDISIMLLYTFHQPVFYATHDQHFHQKVKKGQLFG